VKREAKVTSSVNVDVDEDAGAVGTGGVTRVPTPKSHMERAQAMGRVEQFAELLDWIRRGNPSCQEIARGGKGKGLLIKDVSGD
jgi:hypothetical protein